MEVHNEQTKIVDRLKRLWVNSDILLPKSKT